MDTNEARRLSEQAKIMQGKEARKLAAKLKKDEKIVRQQAKKDARKILKEIYSDIAKAAGKERKVSKYFEYKDSQMGYAYLETLVKTVRMNLKKSYRFNIHYYDSHTGPWNSAIIYVEW